MTLTETISKIQATTNQLKTFIDVGISNSLLDLLIHCNLDFSFLEAFLVFRKAVNDLEGEFNFTIVEEALEALARTFVQAQ